jgi:hypothetical protein
MNNQSRLPVFNVRVFFLEEEKALSKEHGRSAFWAQVRKCKRYSNPPELSDDQFEQLIEQKFGISLKKGLVKYFSLQRHTRDNVYYSILGSEETPYLLSAVFFRGKIAGYGSLDFSVEIAGIDRLIKLFDNNFDLFRMFLDAYIPIAFQDTIDDWNPKLSFEITALEQIREMFTLIAPQQQNAIITENKREQNRDDRVKWFWTVANTSLILPVILALGVLYVQFKALSEERAQLIHKISEITKKEEMHEKLQSDRFQELNKFALELLRLSKQQPTEKSTTTNNK